MRKNALWKSLILLVTAVSVAGMSGGLLAADKQTRKIGVFVPLTGENAENGQQIKNAIELYAKQFNADDHAVTLDLIVRDDRGEPKTATNIAREFVSQGDILAAVGSFTSTAAMAAAPIFDKAGIPQISPTSSHPDFTGLAQYAFRGTPTQEVEASLIADYATETLNNKTAAIVYRQDDWGNSAANVFAKAFENDGGTIVGKEAVPPNSHNLRTVVTSLKGKKPDVVYVALHYSSAAILAQRMQAAQWQPDVITATSLYTHKLIDLAGEAAVEDWYVPAFFYAESSDPTVAAFVESFETAYGAKPDAFAAAGYDSMAAIGEALIELDKPDASRSELGDKLFEVNVPGATGHMHFDEQGDVQKPVTWLQIRDGAFNEL